MHDVIASEILKTQSEQTRLLKEILHGLRALSRQLKHLNPRNVTAAQVKETSLMANTPGSSHVFTVTLEPADATFVPTSAVFTVTGIDESNLTVDPSGLSATLAIPADAVVGSGVAINWSYTNADGTTAAASDSFTVEAAVIDVTGATISEVS
jgi:hypothetical protein